MILPVVLHNQYNLCIRWKKKLPRWSERTNFGERGEAEKKIVWQLSKEKLLNYFSTLESANLFFKADQVLNTHERRQGLCLSWALIVGYFVVGTTQKYHFFLTPPLSNLMSNPAIVIFILVLIEHTISIRSKYDA